MVVGGTHIFLQGEKEIYPLCIKKRKFLRRQEFKGGSPQYSVASRKFVLVVRLPASSDSRGGQCRGEVVAITEDVGRLLWGV